MKEKDMNEYLIKNYQEEEKMMVLIYAQWCVNNDIDPLHLYHEAYPDQSKNDLLEEVLEFTVEKEEADIIHPETVIQALQAFGNDDLAFMIERNLSERRKKDKN